MPLDQFFDYLAIRLDGPRAGKVITLNFDFTDTKEQCAVTVEKAGAMDNTLIFYIVGDNGASGEGGLEGTVNEVASLNGIQLGLKGLQDKFDEIGGPTTEPHVPVGWAWAADTPFQWTKQVSSHFGGTRNPFRYSVEPFDIGMDNVSAVSEEYKPPFPFKGRIEQVKIELK